MPIAQAKWVEAVPWIDRHDADIEAVVRRSRDELSFDLRDALTRWRQDGIVVFKGAVPDSLIAEFDSDLSHLLAHHRDYVVPIEFKGGRTYSQSLSEAQIHDPGVKFNHLHTLSRAAARLSLARPVAEFLRIVFEAPPIPMQSLTFLRGSEQPIHIDYPYVNRQRRLPYMAASWVALEDVGQDAGPLAYFAGAHRLDVSGFFDWGDGNIIKIEGSSTQNSMQFARFLTDQVSRAGIKPTIYLPKRGDVLVWHANLPHWGTPIINPALTRRSYVTHYTSLNDYPEQWRLKPEELAGRSIQEHGGIVYDFPWNRGAVRLPSWYV